MTEHLYRDLAWLQKRPDDFAQQCKLALETADGLGRTLQALANHRLDGNDLVKLAKVAKKARKDQVSLAPLVPFRLAIVSNSTAKVLAAPLVATALRHGIDLDVIETDFGQVLQEVLSPSSALYQGKPDAILVAIDYHGLQLNSVPGGAEAAGEAVASGLDYFGSIRQAIRANSSAVCIFQTVPRPIETLFGNIELSLQGTQRAAIDAINRGLAEMVSGTTDLLFDVSALAETVGLAGWHDATLWNIAKLAFAPEFQPLYADHVCRLIAALRGKSRRCLILDLDNTLWGGVIGDDGLDGIVIGQGDPTGEAYLSVQTMALALRARGVVLAVSSKNTDEIARGPFRQHPEMLIKENHIAVFQANWNDKATNIKAIAEELSLGLDAMVFLDDNPVERGLVRRILPQVAVPELPEDPAYYARTLAAAGYFEATGFSDEDRARAEFYQNNARRVALQQQAGDVDSYLASLDMTITFASFDDIGRARIAQLINKSNQYNLTTRRYTEAEVQETQRDPDAFALQVRLSDVYGDNGMISVVICRRQAQDWVVDTWLMSCRVLNRKVETAVLMEILAEARRRGIARILGCYRPTERNAMVADHYARLNFAELARHPDGSTEWVLDVAAAADVPVPMTVHHASAVEA
jgi:FkbH-like protein